MTQKTTLNTRAVIQCVGALDTDFAHAIEWDSKAGWFVTTDGYLSPDIEDARIFGREFGCRWDNNPRYRRLPVTVEVTL